MAGPAPHRVVPGAGGVVDGRARFREIFCEVLREHSPADAAASDCGEWLWQLDDERPAGPEPLPAPDLRPQVYLVTGAFSDCLGNEAKPFAGAIPALEAKGYRIATIVVSGRSGSTHNARQIAERLAGAPRGEEAPVVLIGYSAGW